jgi:amidase
MKQTQTHSPASEPIAIQTAHSKAAEDSRTPKPRGILNAFVDCAATAFSMRGKWSARFWSAAVLCRFVPRFSIISLRDADPVTSFDPQHIVQRKLTTFGTRVFLLCSFLGLSLAAAAAAEVSGEWEFAGKSLGETSYARIILKSQDGKLTGTLNELKLEGTVKSDEVSFSATRPNGDHFGDFTGKLTGEKLEGAAVWSGKRKITWSAKRPATPPDHPLTHDFQPTEFHRVFSDAIPPVMHIFPGDTVRTWTVDAGGVDSEGVQRSQGGNPETGPFYVEGAFPGDTLGIKLNRVRLNRDWAESGDRIVPTALTAGYIERTKYQDKFSSTWVLDREQGVARLKSPSAHLTNYTVKLQPMLGCIAVAPPGHQSFRTGYLGGYGGNMDYNQLREGTTVYLPVFVPGALLFVGDGHAAQGDGELTGDALETSMDVELTVSLLKGQPSPGPRAENDDYLMVLGIANSLPEALQSATTELANWLQREYKLEPNEAAVVLGTAMQYNIAEVVDPLVHVVAKLPKKALEPLSH